MATNNENQTQLKLIMEYYKKFPKQAISHPQAVDWLVYEYNKRTGKVFRDPDRGIRSLSQKGKLIKISKGVYKYDPDLIRNPKLEDFTAKQKKKIFKRDNYCCVVCGKGKKDGVEIHADHIMPKDLGGEATIENGQTLCSKHNFKKKNYKQTETGKKMFIRLYDLAKSKGDKELQKFCSEILEVFERNDINGHIIWQK